MRVFKWLILKRRGAVNTTLSIRSWAVVGEIAVQYRTILQRKFSSVADVDPSLNQREVVFVDDRTGIGFRQVVTARELSRAATNCAVAL